MDTKFVPLSQDDTFEDGQESVEKQTSHWSGHLWKILIILLIFTNLATWAFLSGHGRMRAPQDYAQTLRQKTLWTSFWWHTNYSPLNHTESDELWENIMPQHGFIAVDRHWAADHHWPISMYLPSDHSKGVYLLEAYHQLHCLRIIRKTFWEAIENRPFTYHPSSHMEHCFDALRQSAICNADNTPLYTFGDKTAGDGQLHQCYDWNELREYATANTACYRDSIGDIPLGDHFGHCDDGIDGVEVLGGQGKQ
ncbi:hypothetical protein EV356DRAFT_510582 [Viridothelium virens]|uniref:Uncharacterized protein n=1 Tax=Viridothelium virens TaxID=1048519 RepID=A0A6A6HI33_VIRVR|nr:hypothetical protein EV356DRAFT_510582 [Viridothelium virens]